MEIPKVRVQTNSAKKIGSLYENFEDLSSNKNKNSSHVVQEQTKKGFLDTDPRVSSSSEPIVQSLTRSKRS